MKLPRRIRIAPDRQPSSGVPHRLSGVRASSWSEACARPFAVLRVSGVAIQPGRNGVDANALGAQAIASDRVNCAIPPLLAL